MTRWTPKPQANREPSQRDASPRSRPAGMPVATRVVAAGELRPGRSSLGPAPGRPGAARQVGVEKRFLLDDADMDDAAKAAWSEDADVVAKTASTRPVTLP